MEGLKLHLLGAATSVGVASNFGAIIGGVLFGIEVNTSYFPVSFRILKQSIV
jgi:H+/Cl- antiporter ClcA